MGNIYEYITNSAGVTIGAVLIETNVEQAQDLADYWTHQSNYTRIFYVNNSVVNPSTYLQRTNDNLMIVRIGYPIDMTSK